MKYDYDKLFHIAGDNGKYQYTMVALAFCFWITLDLLSISIPYLEKTSTLEILDKKNNEKITVPLNYTLCEELPDYQTHIIEQSNHSWVIELLIECDQIKTALIGSYIFFGVLLGSLSFQYVPDMIGRRKSIILGSISFSILLFAFVFAESFDIIMILCIFTQIFAYLGLITIFLMATEIAAPENRSVFGAIINSAFSFAGIFFILLYKYVEDWRLVFLIAGLFNLVVTAVFIVNSFESPRFYLSRGNYKNTIECLKKIAKYNGRHKELEEELIKINENKITCNTLDEINENEEEINFKGKDVTKEAEIRLQNSLYSLIKYRSLRYTFIGNCYLWFSTSGIYYGLTIQLKHLPGDIYFNGIIFYLIESFSYLLSGWLINIKPLGRIGSMIFLESISLAGYLGLIIYELDDTGKIILSLVARFAISGVYNIIYTYTAEVYPTVVRAKGLGFNSICARVGGIIFPLFLELLQHNVKYLFTAVNLVALITITFLPETLGKPLEDHIKVN